MKATFEEYRAKFMSQIEVLECGCWHWTGAKDGYGRGHFWFEGRSHSAPRMAMLFFRGEPIQPGLVVLHSCDDPPCINPHHLSYGSQSENMRDCAAKGRICGQKISIRRRYQLLEALDLLTPAAVATLFRVSKARVHGIRRTAAREAAQPAN